MSEPDQVRILSRPLNPLDPLDGLTVCIYYIVLDYFAVHNAPKRVDFCETLIVQTERARLVRRALVPCYVPSDLCAFAVSHAVIVREQHQVLKTKAFD